MKFGILPKEVVMRWKELSGPAYRVYLYFLTYRNAHDGLAFPGLEMASEELGMNYSLVCRSRKELIKKGWLIEVKKGRFRPVVGFVDVPKSEPLVHFSMEKEAQTSEPIVHKSEPIVHYSEPVVHKSEPLVHYNIERTDKLTDKGTDKGEARTSKPRRDATGRRWGNDETVPQEWKDKMQIEFPNVDVELEARKFQNYWASKSGKNATKVDWKKTFENWIISENQRAGKTAKLQQKTNKEKLAEYERYYDRLEKEAGVGRYSEQTPPNKRLGDA